MNSISLIARRTLLTTRNTVARRAVTPMSSLISNASWPIISSYFGSSSISMSMMPFSSESRVPPEDYIDGHLLTDHLEYLDDMLDVTLKMEESMAELQDIYSEKRDALGELLETVELDALFEKSASQKALMSSQIAELKAVLSNARAYASDAPDGTSDAELRMNARITQEIIDDAAKIEDTDKIRSKHAFDRKVQQERARDTEHDW